VSKFVVAVIGVWPGPTSVSYFTPSRCTAASQAWKSGSVADVRSSSTFRSIRGNGVAEAAGVATTPAETKGRMSETTSNARLEKPPNDAAILLREEEKL